MPTIKARPPRCQCLPSCREPPLKGSPFCKKHQQSCPRVAPLSGAEPAYNPDLYNKFDGVGSSNNCFAYAFQYRKLPLSRTCTKKSCSVPFPQPGMASGYPKWSKVKGKRCPDLAARMMGDVPGIRPSTFTQRCPKGMTKIAAVVAPHDDYHFYRQDKTKRWSHKPGATDVIDYDATKRPIYDPQLASRTYPSSGLDYKDFCGYWCIPSTEHHRLKRGGKRRTVRRTRAHRF